MTDLPTALRALADRIEAQELQGGNAFQAQAEPGKLTIYYHPDQGWSPPADCAPRWNGHHDHGVWRPGYLITIDL